MTVLTDRKKHLNVHPTLHLKLHNPSIILLLACQNKNQTYQILPVTYQFASAHVLIRFGENEKETVLCLPPQIKTTTPTARALTDDDEFEPVPWRQRREGHLEAAGVCERLVDVAHEVHVGRLVLLGLHPQHGVVEQVEVLGGELALEHQRLTHVHHVHLPRRQDREERACGEAEYVLKAKVKVKGGQCKKHRCLCCGCAEFLVTSAQCF